MSELRNSNTGKSVRSTPQKSGLPPEHAAALDDHFDRWSKGKITTRQLSSKIKSLGYQHGRLDGRNAAGSTEIYDAAGDKVDSF